MTPVFNRIVGPLARAFGARLALVRAIEAAKSQPATRREALTYLARVKDQIVLRGFQR